MSVTLVGIAQSFFENLLILFWRHGTGTKLSACSSQQNLNRSLKGRRTSLKIAAVATAALEIFGASRLFGWFARFDDFSVALNFLERTVPLNDYKTTSTLKLKSLVLTLLSKLFGTSITTILYTGAHTYNCRTRQHAMFTSC